jgi:hypothetical protein
VVRKSVGLARASHLINVRPGAHAESNLLGHVFDKIKGSLGPGQHVLNRTLVCCACGHPKHTHIYAGPC